MQVFVRPDILGGTRYTNRENGKSATIQSEPTSFKRPQWYLYQGGYGFDRNQNVKCVGAWSSRAQAFEQLERILT